METFDRGSKLRELKSSYPTYEEWKQHDFGYISDKYMRSYPTYEEWKRPI